MTVQLLPSYSFATVRFTFTPLESGPNFVRSREATRWHRPRSGRVYQDGRTAFDYWCGQSAHTALGQDVISTRDPLCGTCEGRFKAQQENRLIFTPRDSIPPTRCPASRSNLFPSDAIRKFTCLVCGDEAKVGGGWNRGPYVSVHKTGPNLIDPCPHHGWFRLAFNQDGQVACACTIPGGDLW